MRRSRWRLGRLKGSNEVSPAEKQRQATLEDALDRAEKAEVAEDYDLARAYYRLGREYGFEEHASAAGMECRRLMKNWIVCSSQSTMKSMKLWMIPT